MGEQTIPRPIWYKTNKLKTKATYTMTLHDMNREQFMNACERARLGFLTALQCLLCLLIAPALLAVVFIIWIDNAKND